MLDPADEADNLDREIGKRLRAARKRSGLSQSELGQAIGVTFQQVQKYERGTNRVSSSTLILISRVLKASPLELLGVTLGIEGAPGPSASLDGLAPDGSGLDRGGPSITARPGADGDGASRALDGDSLALDRRRLLSAWDRIESPRLRQLIVELMVELVGPPPAI